VLEQSTLTYHVSHPLHQVDGVSHAPRGKGVCKDGQCDFLIAVPVKSFDSGDSNRDPAHVANHANQKRDPRERGNDLEATVIVITKA